MGQFFLWGPALRLHSSGREGVSRVTHAEFAPAAFTMYGGFWMSFGTVFLPGSGVIDAYGTNAEELDSALGIYLWTWFIVTFLLLCVPLFPCPSLWRRRCFRFCCRSMAWRPPFCRRSEFQPERRTELCPARVRWYPRWSFGREHAPCSQTSM